MAKSITEVEDGYFKALQEVIHETEKALCNILHIDSHYVSHVVTVMTSWPEVAQAAASHMETTDSALYFMCWEDVQRATKEYVAAVISAQEERDAAHALEREARKQAIKTSDTKGPCGKTPWGDTPGSTYSGQQGHGHLSREDQGDIEEAHSGRRV